MNRVIFAFLFGISLVSARAQDDFYCIDTVNEIRISFEESNYDQILDDLYAAGDEERLVGSVEINGIAYDSVGIRYKGNSSYNERNEKNPLNIKLDHIIKGQNHEGFEKFRLSNGYKDPSFVREVLGFEIARKYLPASQANYMNVYINNDYKGLYVSIQDVDDYFNKEHFGSDEEPCLKGEIQLPAPAAVWGYLGTDYSAYTNWYELESDEGWDELIGFLDTLNNYVDFVEEVLNVDRHLWMLAFDILTVNLDAPINYAHNFYLSHDEAGQFNSVMWDLNETFGVFSRIIGGETLTIDGLKTLDPFFNEENSNYPIVGKVLSVPIYRRMFVAHMRTMIEENFSNDWYMSRASEIQAVIDADVQADNNKFFTYDEMIQNLTYPVKGAPGISELMEDRCVHILSQAEFTIQQPLISNILFPENPQPYSSIFITAEIADADYAFVKYRHSKYKRFEKAEMLDDGMHDDGAAGDGVWGASIMVDESKTHFYIYAENGEAGVFSPQRAQQEYHSIETETSIEISDDIVINEFLAINDGVRADQDGEYDDWIELYNNTASPLSLSGYYLSDDDDDLMKWAFPDTVISALDYLIVWADNDEEQEGLHAGFKLSGSGDEIYLVDPDLSIVNLLEFEETKPDVSMGLFPNGTGSLANLYPSFSTENLITVGVEAQRGNVGLKVFPNPARDHISVQMNGSIHGQVEIFSIRGLLVLSSGETDHIDISRLHPGYYVLKAGGLTTALIIQ